MKVSARTETGRMRTTVLDAGSGRYTWIRTPGRDCPEPFGVPRTGQRFPGVPAVELSFADPAAEGGAQYAVRGRKSLAQVLVEGRADPPPWAGHVLRGVGAALAVLHRTGDPTPLSGYTPRGPRRLLTWLRDGRGPRAASRLHRLLVATAGRDRLDQLSDWCDETTTSPSPVVVHGEPSIGLVIPADGSAHLLVGEDLALGPAAFDLGWCAAGLLELDWTIGQAHPGYFPSLIRDLLDGYGDATTLEAAGRSAVTGTWTHLHDFSAYVGWRDELVVNLPRLIETLDAAAAGQPLDSWVSA